MLIYGIGEHAKVVVDSLDDLGIEITAFFDDKIVQPALFNKPVKYYYANLWGHEPLIIAIGDNKSRMIVSKKVSHTIAQIKHASSVVSSKAILGDGSMIMQGAVIQSHAEIGKHVIVNTAASVDHDCKIGDFVHVAPNATLCGNVKVGEGTLIGSGSTVIPGVSIGKWCVIGAGSVIIKDIPDNAVVVGNPGKIIQQLNN